jgi:hemolysin III
MGWSGAVTIPQMSDALSQTSIMWVLIGGLFYSGGVFFYVREKMKWHHVIWHLFVLAGSAGHFMGVWLSV